MQTDMTVANEIRNQLGHAAFVMMGARNLVGDEKSLQFKIQGSRKATHVRITLDPTDTYTVEFMKVRGYDVKTVASLSMVYADGLRKVIETNTGLYLSL